MVADHNLKLYIFFFEENLKLYILANLSVFATYLTNKDLENSSHFFKNINENKLITFVCNFFSYMLSLLFAMKVGICEGH